MGRVRHIAELHLLHQAAFVHKTGGDGGIIVGGNIPVEGLGDIHAVAGALLVTRVKQTGLPLILDGEVDIGEVEHRVVIEPEAGVPGFAEHLFLVDVDTARLEGPHFLTGGAGGVLGPLHGDVLVVVGHHHALGKAAHR